LLQQSQGIDMEDKVELYISLRMFGEETTASRLHSEDVSWDSLMNDFIALLNTTGYQIKSRVIEVNEDGVVVSEKHRGRENRPYYDETPDGVYR